MLFALDEYYNHMNNTIGKYNLSAKGFFNEYESLEAIEVHKSWLLQIELQGKRALDIGAGSGRDAAYLVDQGFDVVAVEPSSELRSLAQKKHQSTKIRWFDDILPNLDVVTQLNFQFEFILISAVWMHIKHDEREKAFKNVSNLLADNGFLVISLRHGNSPDEREMYVVSFEEIESLASKYKLEILKNIKDSDKLNRSNVWWETIVLKKSA